MNMSNFWKTLNSFWYSINFCSSTHVKKIEHIQNLCSFYSSISECYYCIIMQDLYNANSLQRTLQYEENGKDTVVDYFLEECQRDISSTPHLF